MSAMTSAEAAATARRILDSVLYLTLATADAAGRPWASPVWFAAAAPAEFLWASAPGSRHSRNIADRPEVALVIFDSTAPIGSAEAVYVEAAAGELGGDELERAISIFSRRSLRVAAREWTLADVTPPAPLRLYRARTSAMFVLDAGDRRVALNLSDITPSNA